MNITQKEMAERIGVSQQYYNKFEKGTGQPNLAALYKIRDVTNESLDFLVGYYFEDSRGQALYDMYAQARSLRTQAEDDLKYAVELLRSDEPNKRMAAINVNLVQRSREELRNCFQREEKTLNMFFEYASTIPGFDGDLAKREYWVDIYDEYMNSGRTLSDNFWEEFKKM